MRHALRPIALGVLLARSAAAAVPDGWFAFPMIAGNGALGAADTAFLNPTASGSNGFVSVIDGHFADGAGNRIRFFGTNLTATACFPKPEDAPRLARRLAALGFNLVRLHFMDIEKPNGLMNADLVTFDPAQLDRLDRLVAELRNAGIYVDLNLHVARRYPGIHGAAADRFGFGKVLDRFYPPFIALQEDYARKLLGHVNPHTGNAYAAEPAVAMIELNNENTMLPFWGGSLQDLPEPFAAELQRQWNDWLKRIYGTDAKLRAAWARDERAAGPDLLTRSRGWTGQSSGGAAASLATAGTTLRWTATRAGSLDWHLQLMRTGVALAEGEDYECSFRYRADVAVALTAMLDTAPWSGLGLAADLPASPAWTSRTIRFRAGGSSGPRARLNLSTHTATGFVELADVRLRAAARTALAPGESLARGTVRPRIDGGTEASVRNWWAFVAATERATTRRLVRLLKEELKVRVPITDTQADYGGGAGLLRESGEGDYLDAHAYWEHPEFTKGSWDPEFWRIGNSSQIRSDSGGALADLAMARVAGKPFTISEYNAPNPSDYGAQTMPLLASMAAFQDWDAVMPYTYMDFKAEWDTDRLAGFFDLAGNPGKLVFAPASALAFRRGLIAPGTRTATLTLPADAAPDLLVSGRTSPRRLWSDAGVSATLVSTTRLAVRVDPAATAISASRQDGAPGAMSWTPRDPHPVFTVAAPGFRLVAGDVADRTIAVGDLGLAFGRWACGHAVLTAVSLDEHPIANASRVLVSVAARVENQGMGWNADRTSVGKRWGTGPAIAERVPVTLTLPGAGWRVTPLDGRGRSAGTIPVRSGRGSTTMALNAPGTVSSLWFLVERRSQ